MLLPYMVNILGEDATPTTPEEKDLLSRRAVILDWESGYNHQQEPVRRRCPFISTIGEEHH